MGTSPRITFGNYMFHLETMSLWSYVKDLPSFLPSFLGFF
jgi:hypothetical protein